MRKLILCCAIAAAAWSPARAVLADAAGDREAAQLIAKNMKQSGQLKDYRVGVKFQDGVAWLLGSVTSAEQKQLAEQIARETDGVEAVVSKLEISGGIGAKTQAKSSNKQNHATSSDLGDNVTPAAMEMPMESVEPQPLSAAPAPRQTQTPQRMARNGNARGNNGNNMPRPYARTMQAGVQEAGYGQIAGAPGGPGMGPAPMQHSPAPGGQNVSYDNPQLPGYAWPSYAAYPNYAAVSYPQQYSPSAWPYIGPFYPYPQVPLGWRKVTLEWDDGWWFLDFKDCKDCH